MLQKTQGDNGGWKWQGINSINAQRTDIGKKYAQNLEVYTVIRSICYQLQVLQNPDSKTKLG